MSDQDTTPNTPSADTNLPPQQQDTSQPGGSTGDSSQATQTSGQDDGSATTSPDPLVQLKAELEKVAAELEEYKNLLQRERADFINFKRRVEDEKKETISFGQGMMLLKLLPLYDQLERGFSHLTDDLKEHEWVKGMLGIKSLFEKTFTDLQIQKIDSVGKKFDSSFHEAMMHVPGEKDMVVSEFEAGYAFQGKVIKPARVSVGNGNSVPPSAEKSENEIGENPEGSSPQE